MKLNRDEKPKFTKPKRLSQAEYDKHVAEGTAEYIPDSLKPLPKVKMAPTPAQLKMIEARQNAWFSFKFALVFRVWKAITGETPHQPAKGTCDNTGKPKDGTLPQDFILKHMGLEKPLQNTNHKKAYAIIAEMYELTPEGRPDGKLWETLLPSADALIDKWCGGQDPFLKMGFADALKTARLELRMTQGELADEIKYDALAISRWERFEYEPSPQAIFELARVMPRMKLWFRDHLEWTKAHGVPGI